jgi:hypothetical protein
MINEMKNWGGCFVVLALLFIVSCGRQGGGATEAAVDPSAFRKVIDAGSGVRDTVDFGRMPEGDKVEYHLGIRNTDTTAMIILDILNSCGCTSLSYDRQPILPGDTASIRLLYDSRGQFGTQAKSMRVLTTLPSSPLTVYLKAEVYKK